MKIREQGPLKSLFAEVKSCVSNTVKYNYNILSTYFLEYSLVKGRRPHRLGNTEVVTKRYLLQKDKRFGFVNTDTIFIGRIHTHTHIHTESPKNMRFGRQLWGFRYFR